MTDGRLGDRNRRLSHKVCEPSNQTKLTSFFNNGGLQQQQQQQQLLLLLLLRLPFYGPLSRTTRMNRYQKKHSPTHTYPDHQSSFIRFLHILRFMTSSLFNLHAWQSFCTMSVPVFFGPLLVLAPTTSYSINFFTQSLSPFCSTCPYHCNLFCCNTEIIF